MLFDVLTHSVQLKVKKAKEADLERLEAEVQSLTRASALITLSVNQQGFLCLCGLVEQPLLPPHLCAAKTAFVRTATFLIPTFIVFGSKE